MIKIFCLLLEFKAYMNSSTVLDSVKVQIRHLIVTYFTTLYLTVHGPPSVMIPSLVKNVTELVDDGTNFNNCFLNETSQFTCKVCGNTSQECFPTKHVYTINKHRLLSK